MTRGSAYVPLGLLTLGLCLQGAKLPLTFFIWGSAILGLCLWTFLKRPSAFSQSFSWPLAALVLCMAASLMFTTDPSTSLLPALQIVVAIAAALLLRHSPWTLPEKIVWRGLFVLGVITLLRTLYQIKTGPNALGLFETYGFIPSNPSFNAIWMSSLSIAFATRALLRKQRLGPEQMAEILLAAALAILVVVNPARTRSAPLALGVGLLYALSLRFSLKRVALGAVLAVGLALTVLPMSFIEARLRITGKYAEPNYRTQIWNVAVRSALDRPLTGYGPGNFEMGYQKHAFPVNSDFVRYSRTTEFAHNEYLQVAADWGLPAFFLVLFFIVRTLRANTRTAPEIQKPAKAVFLVLCCDAFFNPAWHVPFLLYVALFWGIWLTRAKHADEKNMLITPERRIWLTLGGGLLFISLEVLLAYSMMRSAWASQNNWPAILRLNPYEASAWNALGDRVPDLAAAVRMQRRAVQLVPDQAYFHESLAFALERSGSPDVLDEALQEYRAAYALAPTRAIYALGIGRHLYRQGDARSALGWFETARQLEPHYWEAYLWVARALAATGERRRAQSILRQLPVERETFLARQREAVSHLTAYLPSGYERMILSYDPDVIAAEWRKLTR